MPTLELAVPGISPSWSPDGEHLAFVRVDYEVSKAETRSDLAEGRRDAVCVMGIDGAGLHFIDAGYHPQWGVDGRTVYYIRFNQVRRTSLDGERQTIVDQDDINPFHFHLAPDGKKIAFVSNPANTYGLYTVDTDGSNLICLVPYSSIGISEPSWSPDSTRIVFEQRSGIEIIDVTSGRRSGIVKFGRSPVWSPKADKIAFYTSFSTGLLSGENPQQGIDDGIHLLDLGTGKRTTIRCDVNWYRQPLSWSPNGRYLAFVQERRSLFRASKRTVSILDVDRGTLLELSEGLLESNSPVAWSPDSTKVAVSGPPDFLLRVLNLSAELGKR